MGRYTPEGEEDGTGTPAAGLPTDAIGALQEVLRGHLLSVPRQVAGLGLTGALPPATLQPKHHLVDEQEFEMIKDHAEMLDRVIAQVPRRVQEKFTYRLRYDVMQMCVEFLATDTRERVHKVKLLDGLVVPDHFLAHMTVVE
jgi:hypothetical protein